MVYSIIMSFIFPNEKDDENQIDIDDLYEANRKKEALIRKIKKLEDKRLKLVSRLANSLDDKHRDFTGVASDLIMDNARRVSARVPTWFRIPLIKDFNDSVAEFKKVVQLALELGVEKISLLPYHEGGKVKTHQIGQTYSMDRATASTEDHIQHLIDIALQMDVACTVGR